VKTVEKEYDVVVVGGGLPGVCAAISAARHGCRTALVEARPVLGGNSSSLVRVNPTGAATFNPWARETGVVEEMLAERQHRSHMPLRNGLITSHWDLVLYEWVKAEPLLDLYLNTLLHRVETADGEIKTVECLQAGTEKRYRLHGRVFIDCTGDGTLGFLAGAEYRRGRESRHEFGENPVIAPEKADNKTQGSSLLFKAVDLGRPVPFIPPSWAADYPREEDLYKRGHGPIRLPYNVKVYAGYWWIEVGVPYDTISDNEEIRDELLRHVLAVWDHIKNHGDHGAENFILEWVGMIPGKRESRRLVGDYLMTEHDVRTDRGFPDRVAYGGWFIDVHTMGGILAKGRPPEHLLGNPDLSDLLVVEPYSIPFRALYSRNVSNLLMAGRDVSATHVALGSIRVMLTGAAMGQAVGTAAAMCVRYGLTPRQLCRERIWELQQTLLRDDCHIIGLSNEDPADLARGCTVEASSQANLSLPPLDGEDPLNVDRCQVFPVTESRIDALSLWIRSEHSEDVKLTVELLPIESIWSLNKPSPGEPVRAAATIPAGHDGWVCFSFSADVEPHRLYRVNIPAAEGLHLRRSRPLPGVFSGWKKPRWRRYRSSKQVYAMRISPASNPFGPENVVSGVARPEKWTNIWISDPEAGMPQHLTLDFGAEKWFDTVMLTFDTNLNVDYTMLPPLYVHPECVRDYELQVMLDGGWETIVEVKGNYQRRRIHRFRRVKSRALRLVVHATNGDPSARVYEVRVYDNPGVFVEKN